MRKFGGDSYCAEVRQSRRPGVHRKLLHDDETPPAPHRLCDRLERVFWLAPWNWTARLQLPPPGPREPPRANPPDPILSRRENPGLILPIRPAEFGAPSLQTPTDFNSGYSSPSESTNLGSFDQLYNTWSRRREIANARPLLAAGIRATKTSCSPMCTQP